MQKSILEFTSKLNLVSVYYVIVFYIDAVGNDRFIFRFSILSTGLIKCTLGPSYDESLLFFFHQTSYYYSLAYNIKRKIQNLFSS